MSKSNTIVPIRVRITPLRKGWASEYIQGHNVHIPGTNNYLRSRTFQSYFNMVVRCHYESYQCWKDYGGRGIRVSRKWLGSFDQFITDMGHRPIGKTLDRINPDGSYSKSNCRWASLKQQARNKRRSRRDDSSNTQSRKVK